jgi:nucleoside-diphosphate-sugar epimerase
MKKILVTGGAGFIGSNVVKLLSENNMRVTVYDNLSTGHLENLTGIRNIGFIKADILDKVTLVGASKDQDVIIHMAANIGNVKSISDPVFDSTVNILGTLNVLEASRINKIKKIVYSSSAAIFGELLYQPIDEKHPLEPDSPYGVSKLAAEKHCLWFGRHNNIKVVALRYFNVYGVNQRYDSYGNVIPIWAKLMLESRPISIYGDGNQTRDFINVKDVATANYLAAIAEDVEGYFNLGCGESITINHLADIMDRVFGVESIRIYKPKRLGEVTHCIADISKASALLNFHPKTSIEDGLSTYYKWLTS